MNIPVPRQWVLGNPSRRRLSYVFVAGAIAILVAAIIPAGWIDTHMWVFAAIGVLIAAVGGAGNYGFLSSFVGTALYVAAIGNIAFLLSAGGVYPLRLLVLLTVGTVIVTLPAYLIGVGVRSVAKDRREAVTP